MRFQHELQLVSQFCLYTHEMTVYTHVSHLYFRGSTGIATTRERAILRLGALSMVLGVMRFCNPS